MARRSQTEADFGEDELLRLNLESAALWPSFAAELEAVIEENSALLPGGKKELLELYHKATEEPYSFLYISRPRRGRRSSGSASSISSA